MTVMKSLDHTNGVAPDAAQDARNWIKILAQYREPNPARSVFELGVSLLPFLAIWAAAWWMLSFAPWASFGLALVNGLFLVRLFIIQHDCGHGGYFQNRTLSDWVGRALGVLTLTPYDVWKRTHAEHHSASGNLSARGMGDIYTMTVSEYLEMSWLGRLWYRSYRHPLTLFVLGPAYLFLLANRLPLGLMKSGWRYWTSAMGTNVALLAILGVLLWTGGIWLIVLVFLPTVMVAASAGVWLFYVQHQFEDTHWDHGNDWHLHEAALHGSSHYVMPKVLQWFSGNIGVHHVHHLYSRIPFYRLTEVLRDHKALLEAQRLTIGESIATARLHLWDETHRKLMSFRAVHQAYGPVGG